MKSLFLFLFIVYSTMFAGTLQSGSARFFDTSTTNNFNIGTNESEKKVNDSAGKKESVYNVNFYGLEFMFPDQPADQQFITAMTGFGVTYKFSEVAHFWGKYSTFLVKGVELNGTGTNWKHEHLIVGYGIRFKYQDEKQIVLNLGVSESKVSDATYGTIGGLKMGLAADVKYLWLSDNSSYGIVLSILEVGSDETSFENYKKGGYISIGFTAEFGVPDL